MAVAHGSTRTLVSIWRSPSRDGSMIAQSQLADTCPRQWVEPTQGPRGLCVRPGRALCSGPGPHPANPNIRLFPEHSETPAWDGQVPLLFPCKEINNLAWELTGERPPLGESRSLSSWGCWWTPTPTSLFQGSLSCCHLSVPSREINFLWNGNCNKNCNAGSFVYFLFGV